MKTILHEMRLNPCEVRVNIEKLEKTRNFDQLLVFLQFSADVQLDLR